jgi:predicted RNA binding protein YcfA (HicA-like mRNA interferase family)
MTNRRPWTVKDAEKVCRNFGLEWQRASRGSHYIVSHPKIEGLLPIPAKRPIKPIYIMLLAQMIDAVER